MMSKEEVIEDMKMNLKIDTKMAKAILKYLESFWMQELLYHNRVKVGKIGFLSVLKSPKSSQLNIAFIPRRKFIENFRKQYRISHMIEVEQTS